MYEREQKVPQEGSNVAFYTIVSSRQKQQIFSGKYMMRAIVSQPRLSEWFLSPREDFREWTCELNPWWQLSQQNISEHARGFFFFFLHPQRLPVSRFISFSFPVNDPTKYAWLSPSPQPLELVFSSWNCEQPQLSISNVEPISHIWHGFSANQNVCAVEKPAQGSARLY